MCMGEKKSIMFNDPCLDSDFLSGPGLARIWPGVESVYICLGAYSGCFPCCASLADTRLYRNLYSFLVLSLLFNVLSAWRC